MPPMGGHKGVTLIYDRSRDSLGRADINQGDPFMTARHVPVTFNSFHKEFILFPSRNGI